MRNLFSGVVIPMLLPACLSTPAIPDGEGQGVIAFDEEPPPGVETFDRPEWQTGDRFVFLRSEVERDAFTVEASGEGYRMLLDGGKVATLRNLDLWDLGVVMVGDSEPTIVNTPGDPRFHWPLWVGKSWTAHYVRKQPGQAVPLLAEYRVEAEETLEVPAGTFRTLRILRTFRPATEEPFLPQQTLHWYAPEIGLEVRSLVQSALIELEEFQRQR